jgi:hypothetical protein
MSSNVLLFLSMRVLHVVLAGAWFGAAVLLTLYLGPAVEQAGPAGGKLMGILVRRGLAKYMAAIGGLTIVTGVYLFWRFTGGFDPALSSSRAGMAFSVGALTGLIALILGGSMVGASAKKLAALDAQAGTMPEGPGRAALMNTMETLRERMSTFGKIVVALLFISMAAMALGHYI